ncbi:MULTISPECIES: glycosyl-4,4'-diaponeurosporenoate acyltransferase [unclassified Sutcliffiella]|jgi:glycosyl-4,4'-diaponeurosporenoate acyltransferase|uniref:glycosyl-4,4'-diaponeurosporenoate acyltransferase CrtO family protein n=1 Tax=unclassified Sutcliffiella TaxID=2837532 RepID=UPI0030CCE2DB
MLMELGPLTGTIVNIVAWLFIQLGIAYLALKIPKEWISNENAWFREKRWESAVYALIKIKKWKDRLPEAGDIFKSGFSKKRLESMNRDYLRLFVVETRRGELTHILVMLPGVLFFLWNPLYVGWIMVCYGILVNLPFALLQRYNRHRLLNIINKQKQEAVTPPVDRSLAVIKTTDI